jgi:hypothetical protein
VYTVGLVGWIYLERATDLKRYEQVFDNLLSWALGEEESRRLISATIREIGNSRSVRT